MRWFKHTFCYSAYSVLRIFEALQILFCKFLLKWGSIDEDVESSIILQAQKYYFAFQSRLIFFSNSHIHNIVSTFSNIGKSTLKMTTLVWRCPIQRWNTQHYFNFVERCKFERWGTKRFFNVALTLCDVAMSYQLKCNVEPTLKCSLGMGLY